MKSFSDLCLSEAILNGVAEQQYTHPTPIQAKLIPAMMSGKDVVGIAQTGTGKTAAFVLPILENILGQHTRVPKKSCSALILAPTRELAAQIAVSVHSYGKFVHHSKALIVGGARMGAQTKVLARGVDIIVATPGRLEDHIKCRNIKLDITTCLVLDEADQMMDLGFLPAIRRLMAQLPLKHQNVLLSATMPKAIRALASDFLRDPCELSVVANSKPIELVDHSVVLVKKPQKFGTLLTILSSKSATRSIVFTRTKHGADRLTRDLKQQGLFPVAIHGNKSQGQRNLALADFKAGESNILIATDIAARGIDVEQVSHVFNYELPNIPEAYVHRIGRTGRAGNKGIAISLCDPSETKYLKGIEKFIGSKLKRDSIELGADFSEVKSSKSSNLSGSQEPGGRARRRKPIKNTVGSGHRSKFSRSGSSQPSQGRVSKAKPGDSAGWERRKKRSGGSSADNASDAKRESRGFDSDRGDKRPGSSKKPKFSRSGSSQSPKGRSSRTLRRNSL
ncbi:MAG: DEAD/DEAH box helicase [Rhodospirillaceae bacterium]|nr:DEAD/DEAH box helicase [Rhodospirillaceae bacterium]